MAATLAVGLALQMGFSKVVIEGDAQGLINQLNMAATDYSEVGCIVEDTKRMMSNLEKVKCVYVRREANKAAHHLAKYALFHLNELCWMYEWPDYMETLISTGCILI